MTVARFAKRKKGVLCTPFSSQNPDPIQRQPRDTIMTWTKPASHFARFQNRAKYTAAGRSSPSALDPLLSSTRRDRARIHKHKGRRMSKRLIWVDADDFTGWCCSHCTWGFSAPHLESTVAALAFNRLAQETFEKHSCESTNRETAY